MHQQRLFFTSAFGPPSHSPWPVTAADLDLCVFSELFHIDWAMPKRAEGDWAGGAVESSPFASLLAALSKS